MNKNNASPIDPKRDSESAGLPEQLAKVERQLKKARPCPVELDARVLEQMAFPNPRCQASNGIVRYRRYRSAGYLAASWLCGVAVGALAMFLVRGPDTEKKTPSVVAASHEESPEPREKRATLAKSPVANSGGKTEPSNWNAKEAAILALTMSKGVLDYEGDGVEMRAGMYLFPRPGESPERMASIRQSSDVDDNEPTDMKSFQMPARGPAPKSETTREQLMREMLGGSKDVILQRWHPCRRQRSRIRRQGCHRYSAKRESTGAMQIGERETGIWWADVRWLALRTGPGTGSE